MYIYKYMIIFLIFPLYSLYIIILKFPTFVVVEEICFGQVRQQLTIPTDTMMDLLLIIDFYGIKMIKEYIMKSVMFSSNLIQLREQISTKRLGVHAKPKQHVSHVFF